jgi:hypothetical protein
MAISAVWPAAAKGQGFVPARRAGWRATPRQIGRRLALLLGLLFVSAGTQAAMLLDQGWNDHEREVFYYAPQGAELLPYEWFLALETLDGGELFHAQEHLARFGYLPGQLNKLNPDGLPTGFTRDLVPDGSRWLGMNCAACHVNDIHYQGTVIRIDGAGNLADFDSFIRTLTDALELTLADPERLARFRQRLLALLPESEHEVALSELEIRMQGMVDKGRLWEWRNQVPDTAGPPGYGRVDALSIILNQAASRDLGVLSNARQVSAPVSYPFVWGAPQHDRVQWNGAAPNAGLGALGRNVGQVIGVFGDIVLFPKPSLASLSFPSSIHIGNLFEIEATMRTLLAPRWPEGVLPPIDRELAARGAGIYQERCSGCHRVFDERERTDPNRQIRANMIPLERVGTDPHAATHFAERTVLTGPLAGIKPVPLLSKPLGAEVPAAEFLQAAVIGAIVPNIPKVLSGYLREKNPASKAAPADILAYKARPLSGIWAAAPYLHNGSVPTLHDLLLPAAERPVTFHVGNRELDPVKVGIDTSPGPNTSLFDTRLLGNGNGGHEFTPDLDAGARAALLEYLKTL